MYNVMRAPPGGHERVGVRISSHSPGGAYKGVNNSRRGANIPPSGGHSVCEWGEVIDSGYRRVVA